MRHSIFPRLSVYLVLGLLVVGPAFRAAAGVFPLATNPAVTEFSGGAVVAGTNYLACYVTGTNLAVQLFSPNGTLLGGPAIVGANPAFPPSAALAGAKTNSLVAWSDNSLSAGVATMFGQIISTGGSPAGPKFPLLASPGSYGFQYVQALASDGTNYLVLWQDSASGNFYGQRVTGAGTLAGSPVLLANATSGIGQRNLGLAFGNSNYLLAWQNGSSNSNNVYGVLITPAGSAGGAFQINSTVSLDNNPVAVGFDGTNFLVAWSTDTQYTSGGQPDWNLYGRFVSPSGSVPGNELLLVAESAPVAFPALAFDGNNYLMAWGYDTVSTNSDITIHAAWLDRSGNILGSSFTPFSTEGTNPPLLPLSGLLFDGSRMVLTATFGTFSVDGMGNVTGFPDGDVYGSILPGSLQPPVFARPAVVGGNFQVSVQVVPGLAYTIVTSSNLLSWTPVGVVSSTGTNLLTLTDKRGLTNSPLFYRAVLGNAVGAKLSFNFHFYTQAGGFGSATTPAVGYPVTLNSYTADLNVNNDTTPPPATNVFFTGPTGSGLNHSAADTNNSSAFNGLYQTPNITSPASPPGGTWVVNYKGTNNTFTVADPQTTAHLVIPLPTVTVSGDVLQSVSWAYYDPTTGATLSGTPAFVTDIQVQIDGVVGGRIYNSPTLIGATSHTLTSTVNWSNVSEIYMAYDDSLGNSYIVSFSKP